MKCDVCGQEAKRVETKLHQTWGDMPALRWECPATENMDGRSHWVRWDRVKPEPETK